MYMYNHAIAYYLLCNQSLHHSDGSHIRIKVLGKAIALSRTGRTIPLPRRTCATKASPIIKT